MDRNIFRRAALIAALVFREPSLTSADIPVPLAPLRVARPIDLDEFPSYLEPRRGHSVAKAWSEGLAHIFDMRKEIDHWIIQWSTETGFRKILLSLKRFFPFRMETNAILREAGLPWEFIAIPFVESNWRIDAVSASGATGPWQLLEATAKGRGLIIDSWRDERRNPWRSAKAASKELLFSHRLFDDWILTIAAYNAGPTRIRRLKQEGGFQDFWAMLDAGVIPVETRNYVPQVIAVAYILAHAGRLGLPIEWNAPTQWLKIPLETSLTLNQLGQIDDIDRTLLFAANQELNHPVTPPSGQDYIIKIPATQDRAMELETTILSRLNGPERFWRYTVRSGDTISGIAAAYNIPMPDLLRYNTLMKTEFLRVGEHIYIPGTEIKPIGVESDDLPDWQARHQVRPGDSLWSIAMEYGISPEQLAHVNGRLMTGILLAGTALKVPHSKGKQ